LDKRADTSNGSGGTSRTVVTSRRDDDDLTAASDQPAEIVTTDENGKDQQVGAVADPVPAMPADSIRPGRSSGPFTFSRSASVPVTPEADGWQADDHDATAPADKPAGDEPGESEPGESEPAPPATGTGRPSDGTTFGGPGGTEPSAEDTSPAPEPEAAGVSAAAFAWDSPEPASTSPSSPARNFLRASAARGLAASRRPADTAGPAASSQAAPSDAQPNGLTKRSARQAHLTVARVEPWSVMKFSFVVSLVAFVILFVAVSVLYGTLSALGVFTSLQHVVQSVTSSQDSTGVNASKWFTASRVLGYTALLGSVNIVLITAISTLGAVIYNLTSRLIGGVEVTLRETE
jgi:hypothetical protein